MLAPVDLGVEAYARVMAELASAPGAARAAVLARHGLDEESWSTVDAHWQAEISAAMDADGDDVPEILSVYAAAYGEAQRAQAPPISIEAFARVTRLFQANGDVTAALAKVGVTMADYVRASQHWARRMTEDAELEQRFHDALAGRPWPSGEPS